MSGWHGSQNLVCPAIKGHNGVELLLQPGTYPAETDPVHPRNLSYPGPIRLTESEEKPEP